MLSDDITSLIGFGCEAVLYGKFANRLAYQIDISDGRASHQECTASSS